MFRVGLREGEKVEYWVKRERVLGRVLGLVWRVWGGEENDFFNRIYLLEEIGFKGVIIVLKGVFFIFFK